MKVKVFVPATVANLGSGFDVYGLALKRYNLFSVETAKKFAIHFEEKQRQLSATKENLFYKSFLYLFKKASKKVPGVCIRMRIQLPQGCGLGSSATAVVGGLMAANAFLNNKYKVEELLPIAIELEQGKHPDNVAPALFGGLIVISTANTKVVYAKIPFPLKIKAIIFTPDFTMDTITSRKLMPSHYPKEDVVFNTSRVALFLAALQTRQYELFKIAMQDKIHQPTRAKIFPLMQNLINAAISAGALGSSLSGGGSSIIALADKKFEVIAQAMENEALKNGLYGESMICNVSNRGSFIEYD